MLQAKPDKDSAPTTNGFANAVAENYTLAYISRLPLFHRKSNRGHPTPYAGQWLVKPY
jgi:hypothetical protein